MKFLNSFSLFKFSALKGNQGWKFWKIQWLVQNFKNVLKFLIFFLKFLTSVCVILYFIFLQLTFALYFFLSRYKLCIAEWNIYRISRQGSCIWRNTVFSNVPHKETSKLLDTGLLISFRNLTGSLKNLNFVVNCL